MAKNRGAKQPLIPDQQENPASTDDWVLVLSQLDKSLRSPEAASEGYAEFELDFENALARQLGPFIEKLPGLELTPKNIESVVKPESKGAYYLILNEEVVYIGKSDAKAGLRVRLLRHYKTLKRRRGIDWSQMKFKAVKVSSFAALDTESLLLDLYKRLKKIRGASDRPVWNLSGFGSNDTGKERDTQRVSVFDQRYPLDLNTRIDFDSQPSVKVLNLLEYLKWLSLQLQFTFRRCKKNAPALKRISVHYAEMTRSNVLGDLLLAIHAVLPPGWVLSVLRGKITLYLRDENNYKSPIWKLIGGVKPDEPNYTLRDIGLSDENESEENGGDFES